MTPTVLHVSAVALHRDGVAGVLARSERVRMLGTASPDEDALGKLRQLRPDVVLLDLPAVKALSFAHLLKDAAPEVRLVALGVREAEDEVIACAEAGILGYASPEASAEELVAAVERVTRDELLCSPWVASSLLQRVGTLVRERPGPGTPSTCLLRGSVRFSSCLPRGARTRRSPRSLCIVFLTVKTHVHNILEKLGVRRSGEAAALGRSASAPNTRSGQGGEKGVGPDGRI